MRYNIARITSLVLTVFLVFGMMPQWIYGQELTTFLTILSEVERVLYGEARSGPLLGRLSQLERDLFGKESSGSIADRIGVAESLVGVIPGQGPSLAFKLKVVEWMLLRSVASEPAIAKLDRFETLVLGTPREGSIAVRTDELVRLCLPEGKLKAKAVSIPKDTAIKVRLLTPLSSTKSKKGDRIEIEIAQDVVVEGHLVIPKGTRSPGVVANVVTSGRLGRDGRVELDIRELAAIDGKMVAIGVGPTRPGIDQSTQVAIGVGIAGLLVLGPIGVVGGALVQGRDAEIPAGTELSVSVRQDTEVLGYSIPAL